MTISNTEQDTIIVEHLTRVLEGVIAVYRFGSTVNGQAMTGSDADIAVLTADRISPAVRFDVQEALAARIGRDVDLVDLRGASPVLAIQVIATGHLIHDADSQGRGEFEDRTFGTYARLNEERRGILERIATEGTVFG